MTGSQDTWLELRVEADREAAEPVGELLARFGYQHALVIQEPILDELSWGTYVVDPDRPVTLTTYVRETDETTGALDRIREGLWHLGRIRYVGELQTRRVREEDWLNAWKAHYRVIRVGRRVVIKPTWLDYEPEREDVVIDLDPGMAFGTGLHPTTRLCLRAIEEFSRPGMRALDLGTGSGVLAVALAKMGAYRVVATDIDPVAVDAARAAVERNSASALVEVREGSIEAAEGTYDLIVANIIASVIIELAPSLAAALESGGHLVASGILEERYEEVALWLAAAGLHARDLLREDDWIAIVVSKE